MASKNPQFILCMDVLEKANETSPVFSCIQKEILEAFQKPGFSNCLAVLKKAGINSSANYCIDKEILEAFQKPGFSNCVTVLQKTGVAAPISCKDNLMIEASHKPEFILCLAAEKSPKLCLRHERFKEFKLNGQEEIRQDGYEPTTPDIASRPIPMNEHTLSDLEKAEVDGSTRVPGHKKQLPSPKIKSPSSSTSKEK